MTYVKVSIKNKTYYLIKQPNDTWYFTDRGEPINEEYPVEIYVYVDDDGSVEIYTDDLILVDTLTTFVETNQTFHGHRMINYYPNAVKVLLEFQAMIQSLGFELDFLKGEFNFTFNDAFLSTMGIDRIKQWEKSLSISITPNSTLEDRRNAIMARLQSRFKLNTESISAIVKTLTNGTCTSYFKDSCIYVEIAPPDSQQIEVFPTVENELKRRKPAHLDLRLYRKFSTWGDIKDNFSSWEDVKESLTDWKAVKFYLHY